MKEQTTNDLRALLFEEIESLRAGNSSATQANMISKLATNIINTAALEVSAARVMNARMEADNNATEIQSRPMTLVAHK